MSVLDVPDPAALLGYGILDNKVGPWTPNHESMRQATKQKADVPLADQQT